MYDFVTVIKTKLFPAESSKKKENMPSIKHFVWLHAHYSTSARNSEKNILNQCKQRKKAYFGNLQVFKRGTCTSPKFCRGTERKISDLLRL